jgi:hypothetical protein
MPHSSPGARSLLSPASRDARAHRGWLAFAARAARHAPDGVHNRPRRRAAIGPGRGREGRHMGSAYA